MKNSMKLISRLGVSLAWLAVVLLPVSATAQTVPQGTVTYIHNDLLGSPAAATNAAGTVIWREAYSGYGERLKNESAGAANKVWYTSRHQDEDTGLVYMGARYYDPAIGRFLSVDSVHFVETNIHSFNRYAYANNNPYRFKDPDGRNAVTAFGGLLAESFNFATGQGFNGSLVTGALKDGYNGEGAGFWRSAGEDVLAFGGGALGAVAKAAVAGRGAIVAEVAINPKIYVELEKQLVKDGANSIQRALRSAEASLAEHHAKLEQIIAKGGYPSQVQGTIRNVERQVETLKQFILDKSL